MNPISETKKAKKKHHQDLQKRVTDLEGKWKRALADYHNLEKRVSAQQSEFVKFASAALIDKLLAVLDDLERAVAHSQDQGLSLIVNQFSQVLKSEGVAEIKAKGEAFNPETMDAVEMVKGKKNTVMKVITKGYTLNSKALRPAKVEVGKG